MTAPQAARGHMPFAGHRTCAEVRADDERLWGGGRQIRFCGQCDRMVRKAEADSCRSRFCKVKGHHNPFVTRAAPVGTPSPDGSPRGLNAVRAHSSLADL